MMKLSPFAAARFKTSSVAIIVTAIPRTGVFGSPDLNVSTVGVGSVTPDCLRIRSVSCAAVGDAVCAGDVDAATGTNAKALAKARDVLFMVDEVAPESP